VNESTGYVKCEKSKQPKNNQNCGDYRKHVFISFLLSARTSAISFFRIALMSLRVRENLHGRQTSPRENGRMSRFEHSPILLSHSIFHERLGETLLDEMRRVQRKAWELLARTESEGDHRGSIVALREVRKP
jgi:hypothetical protein